MSDTTTIMISKKTWRKLNTKKDVGETFDDVLEKMLKNDEVQKNGR
jgi:predicted CopG family antitoxin